MAMLAQTLILATFCLIIYLRPMASAATEVIRDISGPIQPSGFPPFATTAALLALGAIFFWWLRKRQKVLPASPAFCQEPESVSDELCDILAQHRSGSISAVVVFDRINALVRHHVAGLLSVAPEHLTNNELLEIAGELLPHDSLELSADIFDLCDLVRFGRVQPETGLIDKLLSDTAQLLKAGPGGEP